VAANKSLKQSRAPVRNESSDLTLRSRRWFAGLCVVAVICVLVWQVDRWLDVHVKMVQIEGELSAGEREAVMATIGQAIDSSGAAGLHSLSLAEVQSAVSSLSWAERVSARRRWPDTLVVQLMRHTVVARWGGGGFVASNGQVITLPSSDTRLELPLLNCEESSSARAMEIYNLLSRTLSGAGLRLVELEESLLGEWTAGIAEPSATGGWSVTNMRVALGSDDLAPRLQRFLAVRSRLLDEKVTRLASVDARYHNGVAVRFAQPASINSSQEQLR